MYILYINIDCDCALGGIYFVFTIFRHMFVGCVGFTSFRWSNAHLYEYIYHCTQVRIATSDSTPMRHLLTYEHFLALLLVLVHIFYFILDILEQI